MLTEQWLIARANANPEQAAVISEASGTWTWARTWTWTWAELATRVTERAAVLAKRHGGIRGQYVYLVASNAAQTVVDIHAIACAGGVAVLVDSRLRSSEAQAPASVSVSVQGVDDCVIVLTSGTSAMARGVRLTAHNLAASALAVCERLDVTAQDRWLIPLPLAHVAGLGVLWRSLVSGCAVMLADGSDTDSLVRHFESGQVTLASIVPTQVVRLVRLDARPRGLRHILVGGATLDPDCIDAARELGFPLRMSYGMTEMASTIAIDGRLLAEVTMRIVDGEIAVSGPQLSLGDAWSETQRRVTEDGLLLTGDAGRIEDGLLVVDGRLDDIVIIGGQNVHPSEVEAVLTAHPGISAAMAFGVPDAEYGAILHAVVVPAKSPPPEVSELQEHCRSRLEGIKIPREISIVASLEHGSLCKVRRGAPWGGVGA